MLLARSMLPVAALGVMLNAFPSGRLIAQPSSDRAGERRAAENFLVQLRMSAGDNPVTVAGLGARLLWNAGNFFEEPAAFVRRTEVGLYGTYLPKQNLSGADVFTAYRIGVAGNMRLLTTPLGSWIDPYLSLGTGVWHSTAGAPTSAPTATPRIGLKGGLWDAGTSVLRPASPRSAQLERSATALEIVPGAGLRVPFGPAVAMQLGIDNSIKVRNGIGGSVVLSAGLRFGF